MSLKYEGKLYEMRDMGDTAAILKAANKPFVG